MDTTHMLDRVTLARKSYDHLLRTRDRALQLAEFERQNAEHARKWGQEQGIEIQRLYRRLNDVCMAAAALGVPIEAINAALAITEPHNRDGLERTE